MDRMKTIGTAILYVAVAKWNFNLRITSELMNCAIEVHSVHSNR